ncbi:TRAP transporter small permease [Burkholderiaceae bacterium FT117]|uniref:TRAP transporter small permease subunit n=1 Tax=Zeimonas sediminis TaxID=2944268 RepID=UPI002342FFA9|nr:TRAP transporter small permease [Zeimonas sediminis]MCM5571540.1 TRAP transporter small permease [Zeimonas sediminis]
MAGDSLRPDPDDDFAPRPAAPATAFGRVVDGFNAVGGVLIFLVMLLVVADVASRNLLDHPIDGVSEMVGASVIMIVFTQLASTLRHGRMSRADLFIGPFTERRPAAGHALHAVFGLVGAFVCGVLVYAAWPKLVYAWTTDEFMGVEGIFTAPMWPMRLCIVLGAGLTLLQYLVVVVEDARIALGHEAGRARR